MKRVLLLACLSATFIGCSSPNSDLDKKSDQTLRDNLSRPLNAEEIKQMGSGAGNNAQAGAKPAEMPAGKGPKTGN
jgi:hypothetical protein